MTTGVLRSRLQNLPPMWLQPALPPPPPPTLHRANLLPPKADKATGEKAGIAELIAQYGSSSATSWLEFARYKIWRPSVPIPQSSFPPIQGYLRSDPFVFAWGNPIVSDPAALEATCAAFIDWAKSQKLRPIWLCVDGRMEQVLGAEGSKFGWSTLSCIVEDFLDPRSVVELAHSHGGGSEVKDFKKNLRRAERENVQVREMQPDQWTDAMKRQVEEGIAGWKKSKTGIQIASTSFQPWLDFEHRRYWVAEKDSTIVAILVLTSIHHKQYQIKNAVSFPNAPRGTSETIIYRAMSDIQDEGASTDESDRKSEDDGAYVWTKRDIEVAHKLKEDSSHSRSQSIDSHDSDSSHQSSSSSGKSTPSSLRQGGVAVTFGITASDTLTPVDNLSGWKITWLSKTYNKVVGLTGLTRRGDFRNKFHSQHIPMYVCYPADDGFGLDGVNKLIKCLRQ
ncbi:hypothetical protein DFH94DRAFT_817889 [Russula ochroleuca]|uniref:Phosphatidylglycerol lysyltransferase C-terminal domain-containing protein n=1 Tax=Russula ochroleuca TaxID=152965 RepID=A0A9P5TB54_9AGAM|nr:hypothetical protein DFH94DRAFT_817889 [Russula ochroleuca]